MLGANKVLVAGEQITGLADEMLLPDSIAVVRHRGNKPPEAAPRENGADKNGKYQSDADEQKRVGRYRVASDMDRAFEDFGYLGRQRLHTPGDDRKALDRQQHGVGT